jgi:hypothetical protein
MYKKFLYFFMVFFRIFSTFLLIFLVLLAAYSVWFFFPIFLGETWFIQFFLIPFLAYFYIFLCFTVTVKWSVSQFGPCMDLMSLRIIFCWLKHLFDLLPLYQVFISLCVFYYVLIFVLNTNLIHLCKLYQFLPISVCHTCNVYFPATWWLLISFPTFAFIFPINIHRKALGVDGIKAEVLRKVVPALWRRMWFH